MKTRVMLINSPTMGDQQISTDNYFPLGLLYLGTVLSEQNVADVKIIDINNFFYPNGKANQGWMQTEKVRLANGVPFVDEAILNQYFENKLIIEINEFKPEIIGFGAIFSGAFIGLKIIARKVKEEFPDIQIITGGITSTMFASEILKKCSYIDFATIGEGEDTLLEFVKCYQSDSSINHIDGIAFRNSNGEIQNNPKTKYIQDLDALQMPNYDLLSDVKEWKMDTSGWYDPKGIGVGQPYPILSSRSCPRQCTFCNMFLVHGRTIRYRSPENVVDEIEFLHKESGVNYFQFMDDNLTFDKNRMLEICNDILKRGLNIQFDTPNGVAAFRLDPDVVDGMVSAGLVQVGIAIESGSEKIRNKVMKKGLKNEKIFEIVEHLAKHKHVFIRGFFIAGMPEDTHETLEETYSMIKALPLDKIGVFFATAYPGTQLYYYCKKNNLLETEVGDMVDMANLQHKAGVPHFKPYELEKEDLIAFQKKCYDYQKEKRKKIAPNLPTNYPLRYEKYDPDKYHLGYKGIQSPLYKTYVHKIHADEYGAFVLPG